MTKTERNPESEKILCDVVTSYFLEHNKGGTVSELATHSGRTPRWIRQVLDGAGGYVQGTWADEESRPSFSKDYPMIQSGSHRVTLYLPTLETLRAEILRLRRNENRLISAVTRT